MSFPTKLVCQILTTDEKLSEAVNTPKVSPIYMLILFKNASDTDSEKFVNPGVKSIRLDYDWDSNVIYQNGLKEPELCNEARRVFGKGELSTITKADFFKDKFCICLDLRTHEDNKVVGSGESNTIRRTQAGFTIHMELKTGRSNKLNADIFLVSHGSAQIQENSLRTVLVWSELSSRRRAKALRCLKFPNIVRKFTGKASLYEMIVWALIVNEQIAEFFVSKELHNSISFLFCLIAKILVKYCVHLISVCVVEHKFRTIFSYRFGNCMKVLCCQDEGNIFVPPRKTKFCNFTCPFQNILWANNIIRND